MNELSPITNSSRSVGDSIHIQRPDGTVATGTVIEDYGSFDTAVAKLGRRWAPPHRYAVALDDGTLFFADDTDIVDPAKPTSTSSTDTTTDAEDPSGVAEHHSTPR